MLTIDPESVSRSRKIASETGRFAMLSGSVPSPEYARDAGTFLTLSNHIRERLFNVLVIGRFMNGKSTLVTALTGKQLKETKNTACKAVFTKISFGEDKGTVRVYYYKDRKNPREIMLEDFTKEFQLTAADQDAIENGEKFGKFANISHAEMHSDDKIFADGLGLIVSPALDIMNFTANTAAELVSKASVILFLLSATALFSEKERQYIAMNFAGKHMRNVFFVVNRINQLVGTNELEDIVKPCVRYNLKDVFRDENGRFDEALYKSRVFYIDAYGALCASTNQPYKILVGRREIEVPITREETGIIPLEDAISDFLNSEDRLNAVYRQVLDEMGRAYRGAAELRLSALDKAEALKDKLRRTYSRNGSLIAEKLYSELRHFISGELPLRFTQKLNTLSEEEIRKIIRGSDKSQTFLNAFWGPLLSAPPASGTAKAFIAEFTDSQVKGWVEGLPAKLKETTESSEKDAKRLCAAFDGIVNDAVRTISPEWDKVDLYMRTVMNITIYTYVRPVSIVDTLSTMGKLAAARLHIQLPRFSADPKAILNNAGLTVFRDMEKELAAQRNDFIKTVTDGFDRVNRRFVETADGVLDEARRAIRKAMNEGMGECIRNVYEELNGHRPDNAEFARFVG